MPRFVGVKNGSIRVISDAFFVNDDLQIVELPEDLSKVDPYELMLSYHFKNGRICKKRPELKASEMKVAFITNHGQACGISSYGKHLFSEIIKYIKDYKLFIEKIENPIEPLNIINEEIISDDKIVQCWERGESLIELVSEIKKYEPDIVLINYEPGLFNSARYWLSMMNQLSNYRVIVIMHSIYRHKDKTIVDSSIPEIIVHIEGAREVLKDEKKISGIVSVIPHGCFPCTDKSKLWNYYKSEHTFVQQGYLFRYKGFQNSIKAVSILKEKYPDIFFTGLCSEGEFSKLEHELYYNELMELINEYKIEENVGLIRGYQSDETLNSFLRINKAAVFPYISNKEHECFGASGAAPYAMSKGIPVITSNIHHFSGLPTLRADTPEEIAEKLDFLFSSKKAIEEQINKQNIYLEENSWEKTALKYINYFSIFSP